MLPFGTVDITRTKNSWFIRTRQAAGRLRYPCFSSSTSDKVDWQPPHWSVFSLQTQVIFWEGLVHFITRMCHVKTKTKSLSSFNSTCVISGNTRMLWSWGDVSKEHAEGLVFHEPVWLSRGTVMFTVSRYKLNEIFLLNYNWVDNQKYNDKCILVADEAIRFRVNFHCWFYFKTARKHFCF